VRRGGGALIASAMDYGTGPMVRDPKTGKYRRTRLFVMTLGYSRKAVRLRTPTSLVEFSSVRTRKDS
jgi:hypothetical protein